jgi:hypothetical protein
MKELATQEQYEDMWFGRSTDKPFLIWFTAKWCRPCQLMDKEALDAAAKHIDFYYCDQTRNKYTAGFCDVRAFPTFMLLKPGVVLATLTNSNTSTVATWIRNLPLK